MIIGVLSLVLLSINPLWRIMAADDATDETANEKKIFSNDSAQKLYQQAITAYYRKDYESAVSLFRQFELTYPDHPMADKALKWLRFIDKNTDRQRETISSAENLYNQAISAYYRRNYQESKALFNEFIRRYPRHSMTDKAYRWIAFIERNSKKRSVDEQQAEILYHEALNTYHHQQNPSKAITLLDAMIQKYPTHELSDNARYWMAYLRKATPETADKIPAKRRSYPTPKKEKEADSGEKLYQQAWNAYDQKKYKEAYAQFSTFLENYPKHRLSDHATYWIGECLYAQNSFYDAISIFKEVVVRFPKSSKVSDALLMIGNAYLSLDDPGNARTLFERVVKEHPSSPAAGNARHKLEQLNTREKKAIPQPDKLQVLRKKGD
jgi:tol-pal system protein YbgF